MWRQLVPVVDERRDQRPVGPGIAGVVEPSRGQIDVALEKYGRTIVERVADRVARLDPTQAVAFERVALAHEEGRDTTERIDRAAHVVHVAGQRQLGRANAATDLRPSLEHRHLVAGLGERYRSGKSVRATAHHDAFRAAHEAPSTIASGRSRNGRTS